MLTLFDNIVTRDPQIDSLVDVMMKNVGDGWRNIIDRDMLYLVTERLCERVQRDKELVIPGSGKILRALELCPLEKLKVVFLGQDPYYQIGVADGLAFSCSNTGREQASLKLVFDELETTYCKTGYVRDPDLSRWATQGVLMLNSALTVKAWEPNSHVEIWQPFIMDLLGKLNRSKRELVYVFFGSRAKQYSSFINKDNTKLLLTHPAFAAHTGTNRWDSGDMFNKINATLRVYGKEEITW